MLIIVDDLGWMDTGVYGSTFYDTPAVDRLAASGTRHLSFYAASPVCSPTRASIMTGRHPARLGITDWIGGSQGGMLDPAPNKHALPLEAATVGETFQEADYVTGYFGKWHLGTHDHLPVNQGFSVMRAVNNAGQPASYFAPYRNSDWPQTDIPDLKADPTGTYLTDRITDLGIAFIEAQRSNPFLLVVSYYTVHTPLQAKDSLRMVYQDKAARHISLQPAFNPEANNSVTRQHQNHATYAAMVRSMDQGLHRIMETLDAFGLADHTSIVFTSDNGGLSTLSNQRMWAPTSNKPLRAGKGWLYEGGIRIPLIIRSGGLVRPGGVWDSPAYTTDLFPTLLALAGIPARPQHHLDGRSVLTEYDRPLYWHFPHYHGSGNRPSGAIRDGRYKLIQWFEDDRRELYDLLDDPSETTDLSEELPGVTKRLAEELVAWRKSVDAQMPTVPQDDS